MRASKVASFRQLTLLCLLGCFAVAALAEFSGSLPKAEAELEKPKASDRQVTLVVASLLRREHLSKMQLDDDASERFIKSYLESLDPMKVYFYQSDIDEFMRMKRELDDQIKRGDISFGYTVFKRFIQRVDERLAMIETLLDGEFDFTKNEELITDRDLVHFPRNEAEAQDRWRKRLKYDLLVLRAEETEPEEALNRLKRRYNSFAKRMHQTDSDELLEMYLTAMTTGFDPHTTYMSPSTLDNFNISMRLNLEGIGAALQVIDGYTVVSKVIPGGAADKQGELKPEDRIMTVGQGDAGELVDVVDMKLSDVVDLIRGKAGTVVRLGIQRPSTNASKVIQIVRAKIDLKDSEARGVVVEQGQRPDGSPHKIGWIDLPSFYMDMAGARRGLTNFKSTTRDVRRILDGFREKGVDAVVLDLRRNGGGSLTEAINLTGLFIDKGTVVQVKDSDGRVQHYDDLEAGMAWDGPLVVVTSKLSASASEILAGAIQDYHRGIVVGDDATHGKGTVQSLLDLGAQLFRIPNPPNLGALKITMQQFYRPDGASTQKRGVLADISLPSITTHMDISEGDLDYAIEFDKVDRQKHDLFNLVSGDIIDALKNRSSTRLSKVDDFQKVRKNIETYLKQKAQKSVSLNEEEFNRRRAELNAEKEEEKQLDENQDKDPNEVVKRDHYFDEVIAITVDYLNLLRGQKIAVVERR